MVVKNKLSPSEFKKLVKKDKAKQKKAEKAKKKRDNVDKGR